LTENNGLYLLKVTDFYVFLHCFLEWALGTLTEAHESHLTPSLWASRFTCSDRCTEKRFDHLRTSKLR